MDSGSGSMQSSSTGADEEYDSRADSSSSLSAFLNQNQNHNHPPPPQPQPPPPATTNHVGLFNHHLNAAVFDPFSNYLDSIQSSPNLDMVWSRSSAVRSEPNQTDLANNQAFLLNQYAAASAAVPGSQQLYMAPENATNDHQAQSNNSNNNNPVRNPKKRSRASRRAPTTVLTTDTTNFRAMVQEFTGIPAPPFSSSHFPRTRLDLFGSASAASSTPPYLLRPFAQKLQPAPPPPNSSIPSILSTTNSTNSNSINYHQQQQQQQLPLNMQNTFQSIVQVPQKYSIGNSSLVSPKTQSSLEIPPASVDSHLKMGVMEGLGLMNHAHVNSQIGSLHQNMVPASSDGAFLSRINNIQNSSSNWAQRIGATNAIANNDGDHHGGLLGCLGGRSSNIVPQGVPNGASASPSDFHGEKGPERAAAARSEGTVESWINCSSE